MQPTFQKVGEAARIFWNTQPQLYSMPDICFIQPWNSSENRISLRMKRNFF